MTKQSRDRHADARDDTNQPIQYKKGWVEFYKLRFKVTPDVLVPRPETELLVDEVLNFIKGIPSTPLREYSLSEPKASREVTILDLGTGAGNIAISLACNLGSCNVKIIATDISEKVLKVAKQNAKLHGVEDKIQFIQSDLINRLPRFARNDESVDIIVTNLPYIPSSRIPYLDSSVKDFEPHIALNGGEDGFELYRKLFAQIKEKGWKPQLILAEIDYTHGELALSEAQNYFPDAQVEVKLDLAHKQRILMITQPEALLK